MRTDADALDFSIRSLTFYPLTGFIFLSETDRARIADHFEFWTEKKERDAKVNGENREFAASGSER